MKTALFLLPLLLTIAPAQTTTCFPYCHKCHVVVGDRTAKRILATAEFSPKTGEEELTNQVLRILNSKLIVTASVFYTDESMASDAGRDSMQLALAVTTHPVKSAFHAAENSVTEVTLGTFDTARVERNLQVRSRKLSAAMQCRDTSKQSKE